MVADKCLTVGEGGGVDWRCDITGHNRNQQYMMRDDGRIQHAGIYRGHECLSLAGSGRGLQLQSCASATVWEEANPFVPEDCSMQNDYALRAKRWSQEWNVSCLCLATTVRS